MAHPIKRTRFDDNPTRFAGTNTPAGRDPMATDAIRWQRSSSIEQAVVDGVRYTGDTPPGDPLPKSTDNAQQDADGTEQAAA